MNAFIVIRLRIELEPSRLSMRDDVMTAAAVFVVVSGHRDFIEEKTSIYFFLLEKLVPEFNTFCV